MVRISNKQHEENLESDEGLALLIPDIQDTANLVQVGFKHKSTKTIIFYLFVLINSTYIYITL